MRRLSGAQPGIPFKLNPPTLMKNPIIFVVEVGAALVTLFLLRDLFKGVSRNGFEIQIALWL